MGEMFIRLHCPEIESIAINEEKGVQLCREKGFDSVSEGNAVGKAQGCHESQMCRQAKLSQSSGCQSALPGGAWRLGWVPWRVLGSSSPVDPAPSAGRLLSSQPWKSQPGHLRPDWGSLEQGAARPARTRMRSGHKGSRANATSARWMLTGALRLHRGNWRPTALTSASRTRVGTRPGCLWCRGICRTWRGRTPLEIQ